MCALQMKRGQKRAGDESKECEHAPVTKAAVRPQAKSGIDNTESGSTELTHDSTAMLGGQAADSSDECPYKWFWENGYELDPDEDSQLLISKEEYDAKVITGPPWYTKQ